MIILALPQGPGSRSWMGLDQNSQKWLFWLKMVIIGHFGQDLVLVGALGLFLDKEEMVGRVIFKGSSSGQIGILTKMVLFGVIFGAIFGRGQNDLTP